MMVSPTRGFLHACHDNLKIIKGRNKTWIGDHVGNLTGGTNYCVALVHGAFRLAVIGTCIHDVPAYFQALHW